MIGIGDALIKPLISEKSMQDAKKSKFTFVVSNSANKKHVAAEVEKKFNVHVVSVATSVVKGRTKRQGTRRTEVTLPSWKKAVVALKTGEKIGLFDVAETA